MSLLRPPTAPRLPDPDATYSPRFTAALLQVLRLYFNQLSAVLSTLLGVRGGIYLQTAYGAFISTNDQTLASATTAAAVSYNVTRAASGVSLVSGTRITVAQSGVYTISTNLQMANNDSNMRHAYVWFAVNGVAVTNSTANVSVHETHGGRPGHAALTTSLTTTLAENDYVEVLWGSESTNVLLDVEAAGASPTRPAAASACTTIQFISALTT